MIISFDLSLSCTGYSIFDNDGSFIKTGHIETDKGKSTPLRLKQVASILKKLKKEYKPKLILIEKGFYRYNTSTEQVFRVHGITNLIFCDAEQIEIHATSVRKLVEGHGNIDKDTLRKYISKKYPDIDFENYDEIDSFALGLAYFIKEGII